MISDDALRALIVPKLREILGPYGFASADIRPGLDHDGDPVVFVSARYEEGAIKLDPEQALRAAVEINRLLSEQSDPRFVHLTHFWPDDPPVEDEGPARRRMGTRR